MLVCHQSFYVRTDLARQAPYDLNFRFSADFDWCVRILKATAQQELTVHNTRRILTDYLNEGMTTRNHRHSLWERFRLMCRHYGTLPTLGRHLGFVLRSLLHR